MQQITVSTDAHQKFRTSLGNNIFEINLDWVDTSDSWFISIYKADDMTPYVINRRLINNVLVFNSFTNNFDGDIVAYSTSTPDAKLDRNSFENRYNLYYLTANEVKELLNQ